MLTWLMLSSGTIVARSFNGLSLFVAGVRLFETLDGGNGTSFADFDDVFCVTCDGCVLATLIVVARDLCECNDPFSVLPVRTFVPLVCAIVLPVWLPLAEATAASSLERCEDATVFTRDPESIRCALLSFTSRSISSIL